MEEESEETHHSFEESHARHDIFQIRKRKKSNVLVLRKQLRWTSNVLVFRKKYIGH